MRDMRALAPSLARPALRLAFLDSPKKSYLGGDPLLPQGRSWPERDGRRLDFIARLSLEEIHAATQVNWLPTTGALLFFYDSEEQPWGFVQNTAHLIVFPGKTSSTSDRISSSSGRNEHFSAESTNQQPGRPKCAVPARLKRYPRPAGVVVSLEHDAGRRWVTRAGSEAQWLLIHGATGAARQNLLFAG